MGDAEEEEFTVEKILDKRVKVENNVEVVEYYLKWLNYPDSDNTWEPRGNLTCDGLIKKFEAEWEKKQKLVKASGGSKRSASDVDPSSTDDPEPASANGVPKYLQDIDKPKPARKRGFARGLEPEKILGATDAAGELMFLIKWKGSEDADLVKAKEANVKCPQMVIAYYEKRLTWTNHGKKELLLVNEK